MPFGIASIGNGVSTAVPVVSPAVVTDGLTHRWLFDEEDGSVLHDSVGDAHLTAYSGVAAALAGTISGPTTTGVAATVFDGATSYCLGGVFLVGADFATEQTLIGNDGLYDEGNEQWVGCARVYAAITTGVLTLEITTDSGVTTIAGPTLTADKWLEWAVTVSGGVATWYSRQHTAGQAFAGDWVSTTAAAPSSPIIVGGVSEVVLGATGTTPEAIWTGSICTAFIAPTAPSAANVKLLLARPTKAYAQEVLGANGRLWVADAGAGAIIQEVCQDGWADSITLDDTPTWSTNLTGIPQAGFRRGYRCGGKPGFAIGTPSGNRVNAFAHAVAYVLAEAEDVNPQDTPWTIEVVFQTRFNETSTSVYSQVFGCYTGNTAGGTIRYGKYLRARGNATLRTFYFYEREVGGAGERSVPTTDDDKLLSCGIRTATMHNAGGTGSTTKFANSHQSQDSLPTLDAVDTIYGKYVSGTTGTPDLPNTTGTSYRTVIGNSGVAVDGIVESANVAQLIVLEVRVYNSEISSGDWETNRAYDLYRNSGMTYHWDEDAPFSGVGSPESPFKGEAGFVHACEMVGYGDTISIRGTVEIGASHNSIDPVNKYITGSGGDKFGTLSNVTFVGVTREDGIKRVVNTALATDGFRTGDVGYGDTDIPDGYAVPHLHNTTTMLSWTASTAVPFANIYFRRMTLDCNELCGHAVSAGNSGSIAGTGFYVTDCVLKNSHDWETEHTAEPINVGWNNLEVIGCEGINNRSQMIYLAAGGVAGDVTGFVAKRNHVHDSNFDTFNHYEATTDAALPDPPTGIDFIEGDKGSAVLQTKLVDGNKVVAPIIDGNLQTDDNGGSFIILYESTDAVITNNMCVKSLSNDTGIGIRLITDSDGAYVANNTLIGGGQGIVVGSDDLGLGTTIINNVMSGQNTYNICVEDGDDTTVAATITYCAGNLDEAWNSETGCIGEASISFNSDYSLATGSDGKGTAINLYSPYNVLSKNIDGIRRSWNGLWDMGAK